MKENPQDSSTSLWPADSTMDSSQPSLSPPSSPVFHGFGPGTHFPERLILETAGEGDDEHVVNAFRERKTGRPSGGWGKEQVISNLNIMETPRRNNVQHASQPVQSEVSFSTPATSSKADPQKVPGTSSRPKPYLLDRFGSSGTPSWPKSILCAALVFSTWRRRNMMFF